MAIDNSTMTSNASSGKLEQQVRARIESMGYLPTTVAVAMKFMELGKNPEADPSDYSKVISSDGSLSSKLLSLANSSWFGVRNRVTKVPVAVNLLGLGTVRTLAISYCMTGLHNELRLTPQESRMFWMASLCKAVAAKQFVSLSDPKLGEEAFAAALFQDFALPVMFATDRAAVLELLQDANLDVKTRLLKERALFRLDHAELGRCISQKLELPELFIDAVAFHHSLPSLLEFVEKRPLAEACYVAALFPHQLDAWNRQDAEDLKAFIATHAAGRITADAFLAGVQQEFNDLFRYFEQSDPPANILAELMEKTLCQAAREAADNTTALVGTMTELMQQAASAGQQVHHLLTQQDQLELAVTRDKLTGALNRDGFQAKAAEMIARACRYGTAFAVVYLDLDRFKSINDTAGHSAGDEALQKATAAMTEGLRQNDLVCRLGGDEFALFLNDCADAHAVQVVERMLERIASMPIKGAEQPLHCTASAGLVWVQTRSLDLPLDKLLRAADLLMYESKRGGGNRITWKSLNGNPSRQVA